MVRTWRDLAELSWLTMTFGATSDTTSTRKIRTESTRLRAGVEDRVKLIVAKDATLKQIEWKYAPATVCRHYVICYCILLASQSLYCLS
jgi:hypothetical protein